MKKIGLLFVGLLSLLFLVNTCSAVEFTIDHDVLTAHPGDIVNYTMTVTASNEDLDFAPITETFAVNESVPGWLYSFSNDMVILDNSSKTNTSILSITVPTTATPGKTYRHAINATGQDSIGRDYGIPTEVDVYVINTNVQQVPEFPSIALPVAAVLGLVAIFGRKKEI
jgi:hypothetical protein